MQAFESIKQEMTAAKCVDEERVVTGLLDLCALTQSDRSSIEDNAEAVVCDTRSRHDEQPLLDAFMQEYGLSNQEGIALMCLAEALLRVPDKKTRDALIADKVAPGDWMSHAGRADSFLVNTSTLGLVMTGRVVSLGDHIKKDTSNWLGKLTNRLGEPAIRAAMMQAMRMLGTEFVLGQSVAEAVKRGGKIYGDTQLYSFDMLGEGARTKADADRYYKSYEDAVRAIGAMAGGSDVYDRSGVSIKLSAIHPRYEFANKEALALELKPRLLELACLAAELGVMLTVDAEEADRLELSLDLFEQVACDPRLDPNWEGFGLAIQAYGKRALWVVRWLGALADKSGRKFTARLVKGAYWDTEIKHAQELGLQDFPVFTRKSSTDLSYLVCAQEMLKLRDRVFCQFATHNAHTVMAVMHMAGDNHARYEFQRLHGMGGLVYRTVQARFAQIPAVRVYAPVGGHKDLLAYLVRRLLENGANSSFVNRLMNSDIPPRDVVGDPIAITAALSTYPHPKIPRPERIFGMSRLNSTGIDLTSAPAVEALLDAVKQCGQKTYDISPLSSTKGARRSVAIINPANHGDVLGTVHYANDEDVMTAFQQAQAAQPAWDKLGGANRATYLNRAADVLDKDRNRFVALLVREAGKSYPDAIAEVREAVDFCRYYAQQAINEFTDYESLPGPTGEENSIGLHGRGVFVCISPWNFPLAIFVGQVAAALAAGNAVLAKPAEQTPIVAREIVQVLLDAGVPSHVLHFMPGDGAVGASLVQHPLVGGVAFTGSTQTAQAINRTLADKNGPIVPFIAETGGQNVMFVDSTALMEQVSDDVVQSAFNSAGQRCSALRVLYLQDEIADEAIKMIQGAMDVLVMGDPAKLTTDVGPIIDERAKAGLEEHVEHMLKAASLHHTIPQTEESAKGTFLAPHLFVINNISELSKEHFGPILHVIRYKSDELEDIIKQAFSTGYGLTMGVHTRMESRWRTILEKAPVGNVYVNRNMVGAVVGSQPFGGQGLSGTGFKAGGPRYLYRFATEKTLSVNTMASGGNANLLTLD